MDIRIFFAFFSLFATSCAELPVTKNIGGNSGNLINLADLKNYAVNQENYLYHFANMATNSALVPYAKTETPEQRKAKNREEYIVKIESDANYTWREVTKAGWAYIDLKCRDYLRELFSRKKGVNGARRLTSAIGNTTNAVLGVSGASALAISTVASAFGLSASAFDIADDTLLTTLDYNALVQLVTRTQYQFRYLRQSIGINGRVDSVDAIQNYIRLCEPAFIEANVNNQVQSGSTLIFFINSGIVPAPNDTNEEKKWESILSRAAAGRIDLSSTEGRNIGNPGDRRG